MIYWAGLIIKTRNIRNDDKLQVKTLAKLQFAMLVCLGDLK
nr:MAG TPA: hypothetical protein [Caudoviricetes sp.]